MIDTAAPAVRSDIIVAGAGIVGLALAIALADAGFAVTSLGRVTRERNGRTVALLDGSVRMLTALKVWPGLAGRAAPLKVMRIVDDTGSLFRGPPVSFAAAEIGIAAFGYNVDNAELLDALADLASRTPGVRRIDGLLQSHASAADEVVARTEQGGTLAAALLVAADGADSAARRTAGIAVRDEAYPQVALTMLLGHEAPHNDVSTEFHTRQGPFTLVPMTPAEEAPHRSSLVWVMAPGEAERRMALSPAELARAIDQQSRLLLGGVSILSRVGRFPIRRMVAQRLVGPRLALAGEAAHALPPIGAQGLNLSMRDAATLVDLLAQARAEQRDPGSSRVLAAYEDQRAGDIALRAAGVDGLNRALLSSLLPVDALRGAGLMALSAVAPMRRAVMRQGLMPRHAIPSLMR